MAHFAELDNNNVVLRVIVIGNDKTHNEDGVEQEALGIAYCKSLFGENTNWIQTSYNENFRGDFAAVSDIYNPQADKFIPSPRGEVVSVDEDELPE